MLLGCSKLRTLTGFKYKRIQPNKSTMENHDPLNVMERGSQKLWKLCITAKENVAEKLSDLLKAANNWWESRFELISGLLDTIR